MSSKATRYLLGAVIAAVAAASLAAPALAKKAKRHAAPEGYQGMITSGPFADPRSFGFHRGPDGIWYSSTGSVVPSYVINAPEKCWVEQGYNRWGGCDSGPL